jgi:hemoglobin
MTLSVRAVHDEPQRTEIEAAIGACVRSFYDKGLADPLIGPIFRAIPDLFGHLEIIQNFWSKSLLGTDRYQGSPFPAHINLPVEPGHFERWLDLFAEAARETLPQSQAEQAIAKAHHMARSFQAGLFPFIDEEGRPSRFPPH